MIQLRNKPHLSVKFYKSVTNHEPVREWLSDMEQGDKKVIGEDIKTVQIGWPLGMPLVRSLGSGLWEIRSKLKGGRIARVIFILYRNTIVLLNGFIKKTQKTPRQEIELALKRKREVETGDIQ